MTILLFEPDQRDAEMFLANTFSYSRRPEQVLNELDHALAARLPDHAPPCGAQGPKRPGKNQSSPAVIVT